MVSLSAAHIGAEHTTREKLQIIRENFIIPPDDMVLIDLNEAPLKNFKPSDTVRVFVWNICKASYDGWQYDFNSFAVSSDLFLIQETYLNDTVKSTLKNIPDFEWKTAISFIFKRKNIPTGVTTGSRMSSSSTFFHRSHYREPFTNTPKMAIFTRYNISGSDEDLLVCNIHALNFTFNKKFYRQIDSVENILKLHRGPVIYGGDFNTRNKARYSYVQKMAKNLGLKRVLFKNNQKEKILDHVFVRGFKIIKAEKLDYIYSSDHSPLYFEAAFSK